jgi:hypothetical protein
MLESHPPLDRLVTVCWEFYAFILIMNKKIVYKMPDEFKKTPEDSKYYDVFKYNAVLSLKKKKKKKKSF